MTRPTKTRLLIVFLISFIAGALIGISCEAWRPVVAKTRPLMGTFVEIKIALDKGLARKDAARAIDEAFEEISRVERLFSVFKGNSEISRINRLRPGERLKVSDEVFVLIKKAVEFSETTLGAFDISVKPLVDLWGRCKREAKFPSEDEIKVALSRVGYRDIVLDDISHEIAFKKEGMALDLGGIAKGYAVDMAVKVLKSNGIKNAIVNAGGDMYCLGRKAPNSLWKVGIQHPRIKDRSAFEIKLENMAIVTSGDYESYFMLDGRRLSHIIDPRTGYPTGNETPSATVIADDCTTADILATALAVLGNEGLRVISYRDGIDALVIVKEEEKLKTHMTETLKRRYEIVER